MGAVLFITLTAHLAYGANKDVLGGMMASAEAILFLATLSSSTFSGDIWAQRRSIYFAGASYLAVILIAGHPLISGNSRGQEDLSGIVCETIKLLGLASMFLVGCVLGKRGRRANTFLRMSGLLLGAYSLYAIATFKVMPDRLLFGQRMMFFDRLTGTFGSPNSVATLMGMGIVLNIAMVMTPRGSKWSGISEALWSAALIASAVFCGAALVMSASRGGFVSTLVGIGTLALFIFFNQRNRKFRPIVLVATLAGVAAVIIAASTSLLGQRLAGTTLNIDRLDILRAHWPLLQSRPLWGYGAGNFVATNNLILSSQNYRLLWSIRAVHNVFVQWIEESGLASLALMTMIVTYVLVRTRAATAKSRALRSPALAVIAMSAVVLVHGLSDFALQNPSIAAFWTTCLGIGFSLGGQKADEIKAWA